MIRYLALMFEALVLVSTVFAETQRRPQQQADFGPVSPNGDDHDYLGDDFVYDVIARTNEEVIGNIDTADLALLAVLAAVAAVIVFGIDKIRDLAPPWLWIAYGLLAGSASACAVGYSIGLLKTREPIDPRTFVVDFAERPEATTANAILGTVAAYYPNTKDRKAKRIAVAVALASLILGTVVVAVARSGPGVV